VDLDELERRLRNLEDIEAIKKLKHMTWRYYDTRNAEELLKLFTDGIRISTAPPASHELRGKQQLAASLEKDFAVSIASHQGHGPVIDLTSDVTASAYWTIDEWYYYFERGVEWHAKGYYLDEYVKVDNEWKVSSLEVKFHFKDTYERSR
jgi:SnoaL-like domain